MDQKTFVKGEVRNDHPQQRCPLKECSKEFGLIADAAVIDRIQRHLIDDHNIHKTEGIVCPICGQTYRTLRLHIRKAHLTQKTEFTKWDQPQKWHVPLDDDIVYYTCRQCGKRIKNKTSMKMHVKFHLKNPTIQMRAYKKRTLLRPETVDVSTDEVQEHRKSGQREDTEHFNIADKKDTDNNIPKEAILANMGISEVYFTNERQQMVSIGNAVRTSTSHEDTVQNVSDVIDLDSECDASDDEKLDESNNSDIVMLKEENEILVDSCDQLSDEEEIKEVEKEELSQDELIEEIERFMQEENLAAEQQLTH